MSEAARPKLKSLIAKVTNNLIKMAVKPIRKPASKLSSPRTDEEEPKKDELVESEGKSLSQIYVDPMIAKLKSTVVRFNLLLT